MNNTTERTDRECGCAYIRLDPKESWYQVVACPDHVFDCTPMADLPPEMARR